MSEHSPAAASRADLVITQPGHYDLPSDVYHSDPTRPMSLSSTGAKDLIYDCPAQFIWNRQNSVHKRAFDLGNAGHLMVLEPNLFSARTVLVQGYTKDGKPSEGYTSADAKAQRDQAYEQGKVPLLSSEMAMIRANAGCALATPDCFQGVCGRAA